MSNMLEQAIIDAAALRETAIKSAETALIDKYKNEFEDTIQKLLEEEEITPPEPSPETQEMSPETAAANAEDPTGPTLEDAPVEDPMAGADETSNKVSKVFDKIKSAFFNIDGDDDELVTINFDGLKAKPVQSSPQNNLNLNQQPAGTNITPPPQPDSSPMMESLDEELELDLSEMYDAGGKKNDSTKDSVNPSNLEEEEEEEEEQEELDESEDAPDSQYVSDMAAISGDEQRVAQRKARAEQGRAERAVKKDQAKKLTQAVSSQVPSSKIPSALEENENYIELTEEELEEIEESLKVDMHNESEGYMGSHKKKEREFKAVAYAAARDSEKTERREEKKEKLSDLQESLKLQKQKSFQLEKTNEKLITLVETLKEQVEKMNISNAKLLYTNKALSNDSLNERQKNNIVENITKATSVSEAKTIYETLQSTVQSVKENQSPKSLSEALNRSKTPFLVRKEPANINETFSDRMKILAGIKNLN